MRIFVDTASLDEIKEWDQHPWVSGFTTNPTLMRAATPWVSGEPTAMQWAKEVVSLTDKPVSIDGPREVLDLGLNVYLKRAATGRTNWTGNHRTNITAICNRQQVPEKVETSCILSVFAGRIMDTGRDPTPVIDAAKRTGAQVLWASVREPYNIVMAEDAGCDIVTCPPAILRKWLEWQGKPLETVAAETISQFERDSEGLW